MDAQIQIIDQKRAHKKSRIWAFVFLVFFGVLGFLIYTSFYNPSFAKSITGNIIKDRGGTIDIDAVLTPSEKLEINSKMDKIELKISSGNFFVGKEELKLNKASIVIDGFNGKLIFNKNNIEKLDGKTENIFVDGISITSSSNMKILLEKSDFSFLKIHNFHLDDLNYRTSGIVKLNNGKVLVNLNDEDFKIEEFQGDLELVRDRFKLNGIIKKSNLGFIDIKATKNIENKTS
ncbi:MAG: hypothetical protein AABW90_01010 [Nanoarchaeota archaeon]